MDLTIMVPSEYMAQGLSYTFVLRVETALGGSSTAEVQVFKSPAELLLSKVNDRRRLCGSHPLLSRRQRVSAILPCISST